MAEPNKNSSLVSLSSLTNVFVHTVTLNKIFTRITMRSGALLPYLSEADEEWVRGRRTQDLKNVVSLVYYLLCVTKKNYFFFWLRA